LHSHARALRKRVRRWAQKTLTLVGSFYFKSEFGAIVAEEPSVTEVRSRNNSIHLGF